MFSPLYPTHPYSSWQISWLSVLITIHRKNVCHWRGIQVRCESALEDIIKPVLSCWLHSPLISIIFYHILWAWWILSWILKSTIVGSIHWLRYTTPIWCSIALSPKIDTIYIPKPRRSRHLHCIQYAYWRDTSRVFTTRSVRHSESTHKECSRQDQWDMYMRILRSSTPRNKLY